MGFDRTTRNKLSKMVADSRNLLVDEFTKQIQEIYGIQPDGTVSELEKLTHLDDDHKEVASVLRERIDHLECGLASEKKSKVMAIDRMIREQGFTVLNRFAALRMCEERGLLQECVRDGYQSKGFLVYLKTAGSGLGNHYDRYRIFLNCIFDEMTIDLGNMFDRYSPFSRLFPRETALYELITIINNKKLKDLWKEDETIGWIYQYFNSKEEREAMRKASQAPRNSRELAVRNQFFTPRYVVEFLTDNTLGRIWYEMTKGDTNLKDKCNYLVRRPNEKFLKDGESVPENREADDNEKTQEELLKEPVYISHRPIKDPRKIRMLDPACGSMHFGLYAFDLYESIYEEAWDNYPDLLKDLRTEIVDKQEFIKIIRKLIIEHNIHGIDIDPRAVQIAGLALWLRAQKTWKHQGLQPAQRPRIKKTNVVCAEPMPGEKEFLEEFASKLNPKIFGKLVIEIFEKMQLAGEAGSLLIIEKEIQELISNAKKEYKKWIKVQKDQEGYLPGLAPKREPNLFDFVDITNDRIWDDAEQQCLRLLQEYAEQAEGQQSYQRKLCAADAAQGFAFIDICLKSYDTILINPPFGEATLDTVLYLDTRYPKWNKNILCAFIKRAWEMTKPLGSTGVIYDRTAAVKSTYENFRRTMLVPDNRLFVMADLGWAVLDANVEVTTSILRHSSNGNEKGVFFDVRTFSPDEKGKNIKSEIDNLFSVENTSAILMQGSFFKRLPNAVIGYDMPEFLRQAFNHFPSLDEVGFKAYQGHALKADKHFRLWWEIPLPFSVKFHARMFNGAGFSPYVTSHYDYVIAPTLLELLPVDTATLLRNKEQQMQPGVCFSKRGEYFCAQFLQKGHIFTVEGQVIPILSQDRALELLGLLNTPLVRYSINKFCGLHKYSGYVNLFPYTAFANSEAVRKHVLDVIESYNTAQQFDEIQPVFSKVGYGNSIGEYAERLSKIIHDAWNASKNCERFCHEEAIKTYHVSHTEQIILNRFRDSQPALKSPIEDVNVDSRSKCYTAFSILYHTLGCTFGRWDVRIVLNSSLAPKVSHTFDPLPFCSTGMLVGINGFPADPGGIVSEEWLHARTNVNTLPLEGTVKQPTITDSEYPIEIVWDGILVDDPDNKYNILNHIRKILEVIWKNRADTIEQEACEMLEV